MGQLWSKCRAQPEFYASWLLELLTKSYPGHPRSEIMWPDGSAQAQRTGCTGFQPELVVTLTCTDCAIRCGPFAHSTTSDLRPSNWTGSATRHQSFIIRCHCLWSTGWKIFRTPTKKASDTWYTSVSCTLSHFTLQSHLLSSTWFFWHRGRDTKYGAIQ